MSCGTSASSLSAGDTAHLIAECVEELYGIDSQDWMDRPRGSLEIAEDILTEKLDHIDKSIRGSDTELQD